MSGTPIAKVVSEVGRSNHHSTRLTASSSGPMSRTTLDRAHSLADVALVLLLAAAAFALGCQELRAMDVWWHVRAGQWVMAHRQVPTLDPFSYASADRPWIDVQWLFQVILAAAHGAGGVPGIILLTAGMCAAISLVGSTARDCRWPSWVGAACWLPALALLSGRVPPRPEIFSLLGVAAYLAVLLRANDNPAWVWALPLIQVVWVNTHALFVLGPIILGLYVIDRVASVRPCGVVGPGKPADGPAESGPPTGGTMMRSPETSTLNLCLSAAC